MNSPGYRTAPNELGYLVCFSPIYRALFYSPDHLCPGGFGWHVIPGYTLIFLSPLFAAKVAQMIYG
jgi:hypothetical protein